MELTLNDVLQFSPLSKKERIIELLPSINATLKKYEINTPMRISHFFAQVLHESGAFKYKEEIASGEAYEGRKDLGNTQKGDGVKFKGRGAIQLTGRANYEEYGKVVGEKLTLFPELVATKYYMDVAGWFWKVKNLNPLADKDEFTKITKAVNGGTNGIEDRRKYLHNCKKFYGLKYTPING